MAEVSLIEQLTRTACGLAIILFIFIATFSRSPRLERMAQRVLAVVSLVAAELLGYLEYTDGVFYGTTRMNTTLALICAVVAVGANLNIKGENLSHGANPHTIKKLGHVEPRPEGQIIEEE
jgi:hypothetical protein